MRSYGAVGATVNIRELDSNARFCFRHENPLNRLVLFSFWPIPGHYCSISMHLRTGCP